MTLFRLFDFLILKGGPGSGNFGHASRPGKRGGSVPKSTKIGKTKYATTSLKGKQYVVGDYGTYSGHGGMDEDEKVNFISYADDVLRNAYRRGAGAPPLHPAQFERYLGLKNATLEKDKVRFNKRIVLKTKKGTYLNILNPKHQGAIFNSLIGQDRIKYPAKIINGVKKEPEYLA